jgi:hypothetical protein
MMSTRDELVKRDRYHSHVAVMMISKATAAQRNKMTGKTELLKNDIHGGLPCAILHEYVHKYIIHIRCRLASATDDKRQTASDTGKNPRRSKRRRR